MVLGVSELVLLAFLLVFHAVQLVRSIGRPRRQDNETSGRVHGSVESERYRKANRIDEV